jgi:hypothetical protein
VRRVFFLAVLLLAVVSAAAGSARADRGGRDVRAAGDCARGATAALRLRAQDGAIELRFRLQQRRGHGPWRITIVHERRVSGHATRRTARSDDSFELRRMLPDLPGSDAIVVSAWGPRGLGCRAAATLLP